MPGPNTSRSRFIKGKRWDDPAPAMATRRTCSQCGSTDIEDVSNSYSGCCNEPVVLR